MKSAFLFPLLLGVFFGTHREVSAQLTWDPTPGTSGVQNGGGAWNLTNNFWWNGTGNTLWDNSGSAIAAFGTSATKTGGTVTVEGTVKVGGMVFNSFSTATTTDLPVTSAYTIGGGTIQFAPGAIIEAANNTSSGSSGVLFINLNSVLEGNGLTIQRKDETRINAFQYVRFSTANPNLTGTLNINSRDPANGIFMLLATASTVSSMERIVVQSGSVLAAGGTGHTYAVPISIAGNGQGNGAIRVDSSNMNFAGTITLDADSALLTNRNIINTVISAPIVDNGGNFGFQRFSSSANSVLTLTGTSTYGGTTSIGRSGGTASGYTILDFSAAGTPQSDMLYHGLATPGGLSLAGGATGAAAFTLQGKASTENSQRFGDLEIAGTRSNFILKPGAGGSMTASFGNVTRTSAGSVTFVSDTPGAFATTMGEGFLGPWAALTGSAGYGAWAAVKNGQLVQFTGDAEYQNGMSLTDLGSTANASISAASSGTVSGGSGTYDLNTLSMTDTTAARVVDIGAGNLLRLGSTGGIQMTAGAQNLGIGMPGSAGALRAGQGSGQLWFTNLSEVGTMTINATLENNGSNALAVYFNGTGTTQLMAANTYTGTTQIGSGLTEIHHGSALGTTAGNTTVLFGASLGLAGGISVNEPLVLNGLGHNDMGALVNVSGNNEITRALTASQPVRINSQSGTLTFRAANGSTDIINTNSSGMTSFFGGNGDITIIGRLNAAANLVTKDGGGTLTFAGAQAFTAAVAPLSGTVHLDFSAPTSPATNILYNGVTPAAMTLNNSTLKLTGLSGAANAQTLGNLTTTGYTNINLNTNGASSLGLTFGTHARSLFNLIGLDLPAGSSLRLNTGTDNALWAINNRPFAFIRDPVNGDEWAATGVISGGTRQVIPLSAISGGYTPSTENSLAGNANITAGIATTNLLADTTTTSLRFAQPQATLITDGEATTTLTTGAILVSSTAGENTTTLATNFLRPSPATISLSPELNLVQNNTLAPLVISAGITNSLNSSGSSTPAYINKAGPGLVVLSGANSFTGSLRVYEGAVQLTGTATVASSIEFLIGHGATSGKVILGQGAGAFTVSSVDYIQAVGTGTDNRIVGGSTAMSRLTLTGTASTFHTGFIGGPEENENNLELRMASITGTVTLGADNTYSGRTIISRGLMQVEKLANTGEPSSLGTGTANSTITLSDATTSALDSPAVSTIRYVGSTDSVTNRVLLLTNSDASTDITSVVAVLENNGTGTVKFTSPFQAGGSNASTRVFRLSGSNGGMNEIVSVSDASASVLTRLEKEGNGTWVLTGNSTHTGGTVISQGTLLINSPLTGSALGSGAVEVLSGATVGGSGRISLAPDTDMFLTAATLSPGLPGSTPTAGRLTVETSGSGGLWLEFGSTLVMDLISGAGMGDNTADAAAADVLAVSGMATIGQGSTLRVANANAMDGWNANDQWLLFDWSGLTVPHGSGFEHYDLPALPSGLVWNVDDLFTTGVLSIAFVPEPGRAVLLLVAFGALLHRRRRAQGVSRTAALDHTSC